MPITNTCTITLTYARRPIVDAKGPYSPDIRATTSLDVETADKGDDVGPDGDDECAREQDTCLDGYGDREVVHGDGDGDAHGDVRDSRHGDSSPWEICGHAEAGDDRRSDQVESEESDDGDRTEDLACEARSAKASHAPHRVDSVLQYSNDTESTPQRDQQREDEHPTIGAEL